eukprot:gene26789-33426_t
MNDFQLQAQLRTEWRSEFIDDKSTVINPQFSTDKKLAVTLGGFGSLPHQRDLRNASKVGTAYVYLGRAS